MSRQTMTLVVLAISGAVFGADLTPLASLPLKLTDNYRLSVSARINGTAVSCTMDSAGGDRVYLDKDKAIAMGIQPTREGRSAGPQAAKMQTDSQIIFEPGPQFDDEMPFDASGTLIFRQAQQPYRVLNVIDDSPAAEAGLRTGDVVVEFNGRPAATVSSSSNEAAASSPSR